MIGEKLKDKDLYELQFQQCTLPMADTVPLEDAFETQAVNLDGETQVLDDLDGVANMGSQLLGNCNYEVVDGDGIGSNATEVLDDSVEFSDDNSANRVGSCPADQENKVYSSVFKEDERGFKAELDGLEIELQSPGL